MGKTIGAKACQWLQQGKQIEPKKDTKNFKQRQKLKKKNTNTRLSEYLKALELTEASARDAVTCKTHQT